MDKTKLLERILNEPKKLSDSQTAAVLSNKDHIRIIAGAGAGKTETLTRKIVYLLLYEQADPSSIVAFTFTEKAAQSMKSRVYDRLKHLGGDEVCARLGDMFIGTIHAYCTRLLEDHFGYGDYGVLDENQEMAFLMRIGWELGLPNPRTFELIDGKFESAGGSRMEGLDKKVVEGMIEIAKSIAHDYEHGFERTKDEKACGECGYRLYCGD